MCLEVFYCPEWRRRKELTSRMEKMDVEVCSKLFYCPGLSRVKEITSRMGKHRCGSVPQGVLLPRNNFLTLPLGSVTWYNQKKPTEGEG